MLRISLAGLCLLAGVSPAGAVEPQDWPLISIVIDDMGDRAELGRRALALPGAVAYAVLPGTPHGTKQARAAYALGREVLLHFPLEPLKGKPHPMAVTTQSGRDGMVSRLRADLASIPHLSGVNIHQGSLLSQRRDYMNWMMAELSLRPDLYFLDSYTTAGSVAEATARHWRLPTTRRQVFLDDVVVESEIARQFERLLRKARKDGRALAIGHPFPETLTLLERELRRLDQHQVRLVPPSSLIKAHLRQNPLPPQSPLPLQWASRLTSEGAHAAPE